MNELVPRHGEGGRTHRGGVGALEGVADGAHGSEIGQRLTPGFFGTRQGGSGRLHLGVGVQTALHTLLHIKGRGLGGHGRCGLAGCLGHGRIGLFLLDEIRQRDLVDLRFQPRVRGRWGSVGGLLCGAVALGHAVRAAGGGLGTSRPSHHAQNE